MRTVARARQEALEEQQQLRIAQDLELAAQHRCERVDLAARDPVEDRLVGLDGAVRLARLPRDREIAAVELHRPRLDLAVADVEPDRALRALEQGIVTVVA